MSESRIELSESTMNFDSSEGPEVADWFALSASFFICSFAANFDVSFPPCDNKGVFPVGGGASGVDGGGVDCGCGKEGGGCCLCCGCWNG